uniref:LisH domain-containing protein n=1 Tax=Syphacia muris TaxID=451379 RepID=A0A0N5AXZ1_9BILA
MPETEGLQRNMVDVMVAGYLARCNYVCSYKCLTEESPNLRSQVQCGSGKVVFDDMLHGKRLDEIITMFNECGGILVPQAFLDFGSKLRDLVNEYTALTNPGFYHSSTQKSLYGKHGPPSSQSCVITEETQKEINEMHSDLSTGAKGNLDDAGTLLSSSSRRKCTQPISTKSRLVENVMHAAQNAIEGRGIGEATSMTETNGISLGEGVMDNLDGSFLSYFPEMVASEFDMLDLAEPSTSHNESHDNEPFASSCKNEEKDDRTSRMSPADILEHSDGTVNNSTDFELLALSSCSERQAVADRDTVTVTNALEGVEASLKSNVVSKNKNDEGKKKVEFSKKRKKQESKKKHEAVNESFQRVLDNRTGSVSPFYDGTIREIDNQKKKHIDCKKLTLEDLFDDDCESRLVSDLSNKKRRTDVHFKVKKSDITVENNIHSEGGEADGKVNVVKNQEIIEACKSPQLSISEDEPKLDTGKDKQKSAEDSLRKIEGWVKLTAGGRGKEEKGESDEIRHLTDVKYCGKLKKSSADNAESEDEARKLSERKRSALIVCKDINEERTAVAKKIVSDIETRKEKRCDDSDSSSTLTGNTSLIPGEQRRDTDDMEKSLKHAEEEVIPAKPAISTENLNIHLEDDELLSSPQKAVKLETTRSKDEGKQGKKERKKLKVEDNSMSSEMSSKERRRKEKELKLRKEREEVDRLRKRQLEEEDRKAAYREQRRKKELEKNAKEKEERERRRREKFGKSENRRKSDREVGKRIQRDSYANDEVNSKGKRDHSETGISSGYEVSGRTNGKNMDLSDEALFSATLTTERSSRKQRELKVRDTSETRFQVPKKSCSTSEKSMSSSGSKKDDSKMRSEKDSKNSKNDSSSGLKRIKNDFSSKRQELAIDNLFETMATPPGSSKREETSGVEKTKRSYDFLRRVIATVEEKSGSERPKKEKVVSSGVDKGRPNLLVRGGHSARGVPATAWVNGVDLYFEWRSELTFERSFIFLFVFLVGMVLEMATRIRRKNEHDAAVGTISSLPASSDTKGSNTSKFPLPSSSDKDNVQRKRVLQLPLPKSFPVDIVGDILKDSTYKETQLNRLKRYGIKKLGNERLERSSIHSSAESPHLSALLPSTSASASTAASPHPYSTPDIATSAEENNTSAAFSQPLKKPRLEDNAIDFVLDSIYGNVEGD